MLSALASFLVTFFGKLLLDFMAKKKQERDLSQANELERKYADIAMQGSSRDATSIRLRDGGF